MVTRVAATLAAVSLVGCIVDEPGPVGSESQRVIGGEALDQEAYPAVGALMNYFGFNCTGTLIAPDIVLTAAHCLRPRGNLFFSLDTDVSNLTEPEWQIKAVVSHMHPGFPGAEVGAEYITRMHDIGIAILEQPIDFVEPEKLASPHDSIVVQPGSDVEVVGYGLEVWHDSYSKAGVKRAGPGLIEGVGSHEVMTHSGDFQPCNGDSGGPIFADTYQGRRIVGVVSRGARDGFRCDTGAIATRVEPYAGWVELAKRDREPRSIDMGGCASSNGNGGSVLLLAAAALLMIRRRRR